MTTQTVTDLDALLGDPWDAGNPLGFDAVVAADEAGTLPPGGERLLDAYGLGQEFVPAELGGRLRDVSAMSRTLRSVFRRDGALALGYGVTSFMAAVNVWAGGSGTQRRYLADLLAGGGRAAVCFHELAHGNDLSQQDFRAAPQPGGHLLLTGRKEVINNAGRADALVLFARTGQGTGARDHSQLLLERAALPGDRVRALPRFPTVGVRGCRLDGLEFDHCPVPAERLLGPPGTGLETALRSFQVTRAALPSMALGTLDTQLRVTLRFALSRRLYGGPVSGLPHARSLLAGVFTDLLVADCLASTATRALHVLPGQAGLYAAAGKYLVPKVLLECADQLAVVLGARHYLREGPYAIFQKHLRDLPVLSLGHAGPTTCLATLVPQLPQLARTSWIPGTPAPPGALFTPGAPVPPLSFDLLALSAAGRDQLGGSLPAACAAVSAACGERTGPLADLLSGLTAEFHEVAGACARLAPRERTLTAGPAGFELAARCTLLLAAAACAHTWLHHQGSTDPFWRDTAWITAALHHIAERLGRALDPLPAHIEERVFAELLTRYEERSSFDLDNRLCV